MIWIASTQLTDVAMLAAEDAGNLLQLVAVGVVVVLGALGSLLGKKAEKEREGKGPEPPRRIPRAEAPPPGTRPSAPRPTAPQRRSPVRPTPPRATPARRQPQAGGPLLEPLPDQQPVRARPPGRRPAQARPERREPGDRDASLGTGAVGAARQIAQHAERSVTEHARRSVAKHAQQTAAHLADEGRLRGTRLASTAAAAAQDSVEGPRELLDLPLDRGDLRRAIILTEIIGRPVSEREPIQ